MSVNNDFSKEKCLIIYGAGVYSKMVFEKCIYENTDISHFIVAVTEKKGNPNALFDIPVVDIRELKEKHMTATVLIAMSLDKEITIREDLCRLGFRNMYSISDDRYKMWINDVYYKHYVDPYIKTVRQVCIDQGINEKETDQYVKEALNAIKDQRKINLARLVVVLGTKCSLRCKECNNLIPYFKEKRDMDKERLIDSLEIFLNEVHTLLRCELVGGEPFLSNNLKDVLHFLINKKNVYQIEITTNGTIVPKDELIVLLQNSKVKVRISNYGELVNSDSLVDFLKKNQIHYQMLETGKWVSSGGVHKRGRSREMLKMYYDRCSSAYYCKTLFAGKLFSCARAASLYELVYMKEKEYIEISTKVTGEAIKSFWMMDHSEACDHCDITIEDKKWIEPAEQL